MPLNLVNLIPTCDCAADGHKETPSLPYLVWEMLLSRVTLPDVWRDPWFYINRMLDTIFIIDSTHGWLELAAALPPPLLTRMKTRTSGGRGRTCPVAKLECIH